MLQRYNNNKRRGYIRFISSNKAKIKHRSIELLVIRQMAIVGRVEHQSIINNEAALNYLTFIFARWQWLF